ncbi:MAG: PAS domain-containing sensor histidine kinase [Oculatellaceae cyanobacterium bins.114]|nr:PAS domain-containing sensor histidine kinase [Oculatellaceae cyanobacterium bins.114]
MEISDVDLKVLFESCSDLMAIADFDGSLKLVNPKWESFFGVGHAKLDGKAIYDYVHPHDQATLSRVFQTLTTEPLREAFEARCLSKEGVCRWFSWVVVPIPSQSVVCSIARDITQYKEIENKTVQALEQEKELNKLKSKFISMVSHEFRTPLSTILCSTELLEYYGSQWSQEIQQIRLNRIKSAIRHMSHLLSDVLTIGRAEAGKLSFNPAPFDVGQFCRDLVAELQASIGSQHVLGLAIQGHCTDLEVDKYLLRHILTNLLSNAIKYSPEGSTVHLEVTCTPERVTLCIQDCGIGIAPQDQAQLFTAFHRGSNVGSISGTGLGLAIVKQCVDLHGGSITYSSELGKGTQFIVTLATTNPSYSNALSI